ncbi:hypothetical protein ACF0H5_020975 [Mactra antiquata]
MFCCNIAVLLIILKNYIGVLSCENVTENVHAMHSPTIDPTVRRAFHDEKVLLRKYKKQTQETIDELQKSLKQIESNLRQEIHHLQSSLDDTKNGMKTSVGRLHVEVNQFSDKVTAIKTDLIATKSSISPLEQMLNDHITSIEACQSGVYYQKTLNKLTTITFPRPFRRVPQVIVGNSRLDVSKDWNTRFNIGVRSISTAGFQFLTDVWSDTLMYAISFNWMACPK